MCDRSLNGVHLRDQIENGFVQRREVQGSGELVDSGRELVENPANIREVVVANFDDVAQLRNLGLVLADVFRGDD